MKRAIYQVAVGPQSKLYKWCINSAEEYAARVGADHIVLRSPKLWIKPDPFRGQRSKESYEKYGGFLPIFEKENAFDHFKDYDQIAVIDADIFIKPDAPDVFDAISSDCHFAAHFERESPLTDQKRQHIVKYAKDQLTNSVCKQFDWDFDHPGGGEFFNSGIIVWNCAKTLEALNGVTPKQFYQRSDFQDFIDGIGPFRWQSSQILLNYWAKKENLVIEHLEYKWNALFSALKDGKVEEAHFVHFFLRDKLPDRGENIQSLMKAIGL